MGAVAEAAAHMLAFEPLSDDPAVKQYSVASKFTKIDKTLIIGIRFNGARTMRNVKIGKSI